jgi:hypothetical protein
MMPGRLGTWWRTRQNRFRRTFAAVTEETEMTSAGAVHGAEGQNVAARGDSAGSLWMAGFDTRPTALSAPAT